MGYVDSHAHLADLRFDQSVDMLIREAESRGISTFVQGGVGPEDWQRQLKLHQAFPQIKLCFGLHPYFVADHSEEECESALNQLAVLLPKAVAIGEMGLDLRRHIVKQSLERQISIFEKQIELAVVAQKPMVLHLVKAHAQALKIFGLWGLPEKKGMVHSFNGTAQQASDFLELGLMLSVGGPVCRTENKQLHAAVQMIPMESLLLETDSPDQPPPGFDAAKNLMNNPQFAQPRLNRPCSLILVAQKIAELKNLSEQEVLDRCSQNARKLFNL